jgi:hypothetical protein
MGGQFNAHYFSAHSRKRESESRDYCPTCERFNFHAGSCADQNPLLDYPYGKHPIPYPAKRREEK